MKIIRIFLASSNELFDERVKFGDFIMALNNMFNSDNISFILDKWEYLCSDWGKEDKQKMYDAKVRESDITIVLFWKVLGKFSLRELNTSFEEVKKGGKTKRLFVYFKEITDPETAKPKELEKLKKFQKSSYKYYQNWVSFVRNNDHFQLCVLQNLIIYLQECGATINPFHIEDGFINLGGVSQIDLQNIPFVKNNDGYQLLLSNIRLVNDYRSLLKPNDSRYNSYSHQLQLLTKMKEDMEIDILENAMKIYKLKIESSSDRLKLAIKLFEEGDLKDANAHLKEEEITHDVMFNKDLMVESRGLYNKARQGLQNNLDEYLLKITMVSSEMPEGWMQEIESLFNKCFEIGQENLPKDKYAELLSRYDNFNSMIGQYQKSLDYGNQALDIRLSLFGESHADVASSYADVGSSYRDAGYFKKALEYQRTALDIYLDLFGEKSRDVATSYDNIGITYCELAMYPEALEYEKKALEIREVLANGKLDEDVATSFSNIGVCYNSIGNPKKDMEYQKKALDIRLKLFKEKHPEVAISYSNLAGAYLDFGDFKKALELEEKALDIRISLFGENHPDVATSYDNAGVYYSELGDFNNALSFLQKGLTLRENLFGKEHPDVAISLNNLGSTYYELGRFQDCLNCQLRALQIRLDCYDNNHPDIALSYCNMSATYAEMGLYDKAMEYIKKGLGIERSIFGEMHPRVATSYTNLGTLFDSLCEFNK